MSEELYILIYILIFMSHVQLQIMKTIMACSIQQVKWLWKKMVEIIQQFLKSDSKTTESKVLEMCEIESTIESAVPSVVATSSQTMSMEERLNLAIEKNENYCARRD